MFERDYIMRQIEQLASVLVRIFKLKDGRHFEEAEIEISKTGKLLLGFELELLRDMSPASIIELFKRNDNVSSGKYIIAAELFKEQGEIDELQEKPGESYTAYLKATILFLEGIIESKEYHTKGYFDKVFFLLKKIKPDVLSVTSKSKLFKFYQLTNKYAEAENVLYNLIDLRKPGIVEEGIAFYTNLLAKSEDELNEGELPKEEVEEGLQKLKYMRHI